MIILLSSLWKCDSLLSCESVWIVDILEVNAREFIMKKAEGSHFYLCLFTFVVLEIVTYTKQTPYLYSSVLTPRGLYFKWKLFLNFINLLWIFS